jgi:hypothetical protein
VSDFPGFLANYSPLLPGGFKNAITFFLCDSQ